MATMNKNQTVYYGPSSDEYENSGSVDQNETVTVLWKEKSGTWCYIEYRYGNTSNKKRGYVPSSTVNIGTTESVATKVTTLAPRYVQKVCSTYFGPGTSGYVVADAMFYAMEVMYLGTKDASNQYAFIEYNIKGNVARKIKKRRAWIYANNLAIGNPAAPPSGFKTFKKDAFIPDDLPMGGARVSQGWNDKYTNNKGHLGYDLCDIDVAYPLFPGEVVQVNTAVNDKTYNGRYVCIKHTVNGQTFYTAYCHFAQVKVKKNDNVTYDTELGIVGGSGRTEHEFDDHVHVCVFTGDGPVSPSGYCSDKVGAIHPKTCEEASSSFISEAKGYYYGPDTDKFYRCGGRCFYDPYGVVTTEAKVIEQYHP